MSKFGQHCKYQKTYKVMQDLIDDCHFSNRVDLNNVSRQYNTNTNLILSQHKCVDSQLKKKNKVFGQITDKSDTICDKIPSLSIFFDNVKMKYQNLLCSQVVYYKTNDESFESGKHHFFAELSLNIDHNIRSGSTVLIYGPLSMSHSPMKSIITRNQMKDDGVLALNYYINHIKIKYDFQHIDYIPFFNFLNIDLNGFIHNQAHDHKNPRKIDKLMSLDDESLHLFDYFNVNQDLGSKYWLVMNDPFNDYRLHPWHMECISDIHSSYVYHCIQKGDKFVFRNGKPVEFEAISFFKEYISKRSYISSEFMKKLYFICIFKALFGIDTPFTLIDFFIHIDDKSQKITFSLMPHVKFSNPRYAPYNFRKRAVLPAFYDPKVRKRRFLLTKFVKEIHIDHRQQQKDFFFDNFNNKTLPVIRNLYLFMFDKTQKAWKSKLPEDLKKSINALYKYPYKKEDHPPLEFSAIDPQNHDFKAIFGCMTYFTSKLLTLDPNIYGVDPYFAYYMELGHLTNNFTPSMKILKKWLRSIAQNTSVLIENELNTNCSQYGSNKKSQVVKLSIHHFKGWFCDPDNIKTIVPTLEKWMQNLKNEEFYLNYVITNQSSGLYNYLYNPDPKWLRSHWLHEVIIAHEQTINTYKSLMQGDLWNFCEFLFGRDFMLNYLSYMNHCVAMVIRRHSSIADFNTKLKTRNS